MSTSIKFKSRVKYRVAQNCGGGNFGEFDESGAICQSFTRSNLQQKLWITEKKFNGRKRAMHMSILTYFYPVKQKPDLPDPSGPLKEKVPPAAIAAASAKVVEAINEAEVKKGQAEPVRITRF